MLFLRKLAASLLLLALLLGVGLLVAEIAVRLARPQPVLLVSQGLYEPDPPQAPQGYRLKPGFRGTISNRVEFDHSVAINGQGLRGPEILPKPEGMLRVLALGDSFTFGVGAEEDQTYPALLEEILTRAGRPVHVLNAGVPGYGVPAAVAWFERHGKAFDADVVLLGFFQDAAPSAPRVAGVSHWLHYNSHLYVLLKASPLGDREVPEIAREGAAATEKAVAKLVQAAGDQKILALHLDPAAYDREIFDRHGIPVLDLTEPFAKAIAQGKRIYYPIDRHLTPEGYLLLAEEAAVFVNNMTPSP